MVVLLYTLEVMCLIATMKLSMKSYYDFAYYQMVIDVYLSTRSQLEIHRKSFL